MYPTLKLFNHQGTKGTKKDKKNHFIFKIISIYVLAVLGALGALVVHTKLSTLRFQPGLREDVLLQGRQVHRLDDDQGGIALVDLVENVDFLREPLVRLLAFTVKLVPLGV